MAKKSENYKEWNDFRDGRFMWADMVKCDIDAAVIKSATYESFLSILSEMGYGIKNAYGNGSHRRTFLPIKMYNRCRRQKWCAAV